jgi:hypothetical protein
MHIVYWAHSYRPEDAAVNRHFGMLIEQAERMIVNFDPPSQSVSEAKLQQNRRACDGMVAVLPWRATGPSPYIRYEVVLALRARMPVVVFVDDRLPSDLLPSRVLQQRFSHRTYFRQVREHLHALKALKSFMGDPPPTRYQANLGQRCCALVGLAALDKAARALLLEAIRARGYRTLDLDRVETANPLTLAQEEAVAAADVVIRNADAKSATSRYWTGVTSAAAIPSIAFSFDPGHAWRQDFPREFQPRLVNSAGGEDFATALAAELDLYEQNFLSVQDASVIERYVQMQIRAGSLAGQYEQGTRQVFIGAIMGDQYNVSGQTGAVGPNAHAHDIVFQQVWNQLAERIDLPALADELARLRDAMGREAKAPEHFASAGTVAAAEASARQGQGAKALEYLKQGGKWALAVAEKIGVSLATEALKKSMGM